MKTTRGFIAKLLFLTLQFSASVTRTDAEELIKQFSLDSKGIQQVTDDPRKAAPTLLSARYGFKASSGFKPYLGTGLIYTLQQNEKNGIRAVSTGIAGQAGFSYLLDKNSSLNIDYKYLHMRPDNSKPDSSPQSIGIGVEIKF